MKNTLLALFGMTCLGAAAPSPVFVTSDPNGGWSDRGYYVHNNMWNRSKYDPCTSTLYAWSFDQWHVVTKMNNNTRDGAVKTYPNVHRDYRKVPIDSFDSLTSTFSEKSPQVGIYNVAYDVWLNGTATPGCTELMIWTENFNQVPGGKCVEEVAFDGRTYKAYKRANDGYIALVAKTNFTSGTVNLLEMLKWVTAKGWAPAQSSISQICFGVEMVSTDNTDAMFQVTAFSIDEKFKPKVETLPPPGGRTNASAGVRRQPENTK